MIGKKISHYKIFEKLGAGGMGEVYKAEDTRLKRTVALKFLPTHTLTDEMKSRFHREAQAAAALNHPNIAHVYSIDEVEKQMFIAMEFIEGKSLHEIIATNGGSPIAIDDAINFANQIANGLQVAHEKGIVHRDIKSANIMVTDKGQIKIMDFGIAKLANATMVTKEGTTMGTVAYMSPEQAQGEVVDQRSDIWSLGVVLYEMISGRLPFEGEYEQSIMYSIVHEEPEPLTALRSNVPIALDGIIAKVFAKDPALRYQHVDELPADLKAVQAAPQSISRHVLASKRRSEQAKRIWAWGIAAILGALLIGASVWEWLRPERSVPVAVTRFQIPLPDSLRAAKTGTTTLALSPDGKYLVYIAEDDKERRLYLRPMGALQAEPIPGTEGASTPFFSPDGDWIGFFADNLLKKAPTSGGPPVQITQAPGDALGATWNHDDVIVYTLTFRAGLNRVSAMGGEPEVLTTPDRDKNDISHRYPQFLPDGNSLLFHDFNDRIWILSLRTGEKKFITQGVSPFFLPDGFLVYNYDGWLHAARFDPAQLELTGTAVPIFAGVVATSGGTNFAVSKTGTLAYFTATRQDRQLILVDRDGSEQVLGDVRGELNAPRFSPDGRRLAILKGWDFWIYELEQNLLSRLGVGGGWAGEWTSDGKRLIFPANRSGSFDIFSIATDFSSKLDTLATSEHDISLGSLSRDRQWLAYVERHPKTNHDIWALHLNDRKAPIPILNTPYKEDAARLSPDGHWLAYASDESGRGEVYIRAFPGPASRWQISVAGGTEPVWSPDGKELFYRQENKLIAATLEIDSVVKAAKRTVLFEKNNLLLHTFGAMRAHYDIHPNGKQFVMVKKVQESESDLIVVLNWVEELKRLLPENE